jgi:hypothetical protein
LTSSTSESAQLSSLLAKKHSRTNSEHNLEQYLSNHAKKPVIESGQICVVLGQVIAQGCVGLQLQHHPIYDIDLFANC